MQKKNLPPTSVQINNLPQAISSILNDPLSSGLALTTTTYVESILVCDKNLILVFLPFKQGLSVRCGKERKHNNSDCVIVSSKIT